MGASRAGLPEGSTPAPRIRKRTEQRRRLPSRVGRLPAGHRRPRASDRGRPFPCQRASQPGTHAAGDGPDLSVNRPTPARTGIAARKPELVDAAPYSAVGNAANRTRNHTLRAVRSAIRSSPARPTLNRTRSCPPHFRRAGATVHNSGGQLGNQRHEQLGPLPAAVRERISPAPRCGRPTKATGEPCRQRVSAPGEPCGWHSDRSWAP